VHDRDDVGVERTVGVGVSNHVDHLPGLEARTARIDHRALMEMHVTIDVERHPNLQIEAMEVRHRTAAVIRIDAVRRGGVSGQPRHDVFDRVDRSRRNRRFRRRLRGCSEREGEQDGRGGGNNSHIHNDETIPLENLVPALRLAATVVLVRAHQAGLEVLMLRRSPASPFMPGAFVFPGGAVDPEDYAAGPASGWNDSRIAREFRAQLPRELSVDQPPVSLRDAHALVHAAAREVREESAIAIDADTLALFSHWITPPTESRRYDTHFFVAPAPAGATALADRIETLDATWIAPLRALEAFAAGALQLVYPTIKHLERFAAFADVDALLAYARGKPIVTIMPNRKPDKGFVLPSELEGRW